MALPTDEDFAPVAHGLARGARAFFGRLTQRGAAEDRPLSPVAVEESAWREMRRNTRAWPEYTEAPNGFLIRVSPDDWKDYWGICAGRKALSVSAHLLQCAAERDLWIAGRPQVRFVEDQSLRRGAVVVDSSFVEVDGGPAPKPAAQTQPEGIVSAGFSPAREYAAGDVPSDPGSTQPELGLTRIMSRLDLQDQTLVAPATTTQATLDDTLGQTMGTEPMEPLVEVPEYGDLDTTAWNPALHPDVDEAEDVTPDAEKTTVMRPDDYATKTVAAEPPADDPAGTPADEAWLVGARGFRMLVRPGDVIGAVDDEGPVPEDVNIRLDVRYFPGVEPKQLKLDLVDGIWMLTNLARTGTSLGSTNGGRVLVTDSTPHELHDGDVITMGEDRPLRFEAQS